MQTLTICLKPKTIKEISELQNNILNLVGGRKGLIPLHISLRENFEFKEKTKLINELIKKVKAFKPIKIKISRIKILSDKYVVLEIEKNNQLQELHELVLETVNDYRTSWFDPKYINEKLNYKQKKYLKEFAFPFVKEFFTPHLTLAYNIDRTKIKLLKNLKANYSFSCDELIVYLKKRINDNEKTFKEEKKFKLKALNTSKK